MKRFVSLVLALVMLVPMFSQVAVSALSYDTCPITRSEHDYWSYQSQTVTHPHSGYYECECGDRLYFESSVGYFCDECQDELCDADIHNYLYEIYYDEVAHCTCYCGAEIEVYCGMAEFDAHIDHIENNWSTEACQFCIINCVYYSELDAYSSNYVMGDLYDEPIQDNDEDYDSWDDHDDFEDWDDSYEDSTSENWNDYYEQVTYSFNSHICPITSAEHDFSSGESYMVEHPHTGNYTCICGEELHFTFSILTECVECMEELCSAGIHDFSYIIHSNSGQCRCGSTMDFASAILRYKSFGIDNSLNEFAVPCAECTFKAIYDNESVVWKTSKMQDIYSVSSIYTGEDASYAYAHYSDPLKYTYNRMCTHSGNYLEEKSVEVIQPSLASKPSTSNNSQVTKPSTNTSTSTSTTTPKEEVNQPLAPYYEYDLPEFNSMESIQLPDRDYKDAINDVASQLFLGNYAEKVTTGGTIAEVIFSLTGLDVYKDFTDLLYNFTHWEFSWSHVGNTFLNAVALLPVVGAVKNSDEIAVLNKLAKLDPDTVKNLDKIGGINSSLLLKLKKLNQTEVLGLMKTLDGHALTKHVGNTTEASLKALRKGTNAISSFHTQDEAVEAVTAALKDPDVMAKIAYKMSLQDTAKFPVDFDVGKTIGVKIPKDSNEIVKCSKVRVIIQQTSETEFYVKTAFPI